MRTFLIGLDGATYTVLDQMVANGIMPNMKRFYDEGVRGVLHSTPIPITPQAWTTMGTGRGAGHHGLHDFVRFEIGEHAFVRINDSTENHCEWMWKYLSRKGRSSTILNWFGTAPPTPINGHSMPGFTSARHLKRSSYPADLVAKLTEAIPDFDSKALGLSLDIERKGLTQLNPEEWLEWINHHTHREQVWYSVFDYLAKNEPSDFTALVFDGVDKLQHLAYPYIDTDTAPKEPTEWQQGVLDACEVYFREVDRFIGEALELAGPEARIFLVSDHGFTNSKYNFNINRFLENEGFLTWKGGTAVSEAGELWNESLGADANSVDVTKSQAFCLSPGSNGIYLRAPEGGLDALRAKVTERLLALETPDGQKMVIEVKKREDCLPGPFADRIPDLLVTLCDHGFVSVLRGAQAVVIKPELQGTHHPDGVILGKGPGLKKGEFIDPLEIADVASLVVHSVGEKIPAEYEGTFPASLYDASYLQSDPPLIAEPDANANAKPVSDPGAIEGKMDAEDEAMVMERLRSLGYID